MFKIITNGAEPTLGDIKASIQSVMAVFHKDLFLNTDVIFVGSNKGREVEISKLTSVDGRILSTTYTSKGAITNALVNEYYVNGDHFYKASIQNNPSWVLQTVREWSDTVEKRVTVYVNPKTFDLVDFVSFFFGIMTEVDALDNE